MAKSEAKGQAGKEFIAFEEHVLQSQPWLSARKIFKLFSYLDFSGCFPCYPPKSFKIICLTCIWLKLVDTSFHSSQKFFPSRSSLQSRRILERDPWIVFRNNVVPPSWTLILPESWHESKTYFKGEADGFKIGDGEGEGRKKYKKNLNIDCCFGSTCIYEITFVVSVWLHNSLILHQNGILCVNDAKMQPRLNTGPVLSKTPHTVAKVTV